MYTFYIYFLPTLRAALETESQGEALSFFLGSHLEMKTLDSKPLTCPFTFPGFNERAQTVTTLGAIVRSTEGRSTLLLQKPQSPLTQVPAP